MLPRRRQLLMSKIARRTQARMMVTARDQKTQAAKRRKKRQPTGTPHPKQAVTLKRAMAQATKGHAPRAPRV
jgi:hypothetical protein